MTNLISEIKEISLKLHKQVIEYRRHIHQNPELSFNEFETAKFIKSILTEHNIKTDDSFGENAVIGIIDGDKEGETIALRADTDALPIEEVNTFDFKSRNNGVMHACGHDAHTASLLGTAIILNSLKQHIEGQIILVFQPAEEKNPGGASILIEKGLISKFDIKKIVGQHVMPETPTGKFLFGPGMLMASTDELYVSFEGVGGHAALPSSRSDTVLALVEFISKAKEFEQSLSSDYPFIIAFGKLEAKGAVNVIPNESLCHGTMRTFNENLRKIIQKGLEEIANKCAIKHKCSAKFEICHGYPSLENNHELTKTATNVAMEFVGKDNIQELKLRMTAEDFAYYAKEIPGVFYRMGISGNGKGNTGLHNPEFDMDEAVFINSIGLMAYIALKIA